MATTTGTIDELRDEAMHDLQAAADRRALDDWRIAWLGRKGRLTGVLRSLAELPVDDRRTLGTAANDLKAVLEAAHEARSEELRRASLARSVESGRIDVTLPARPLRRGALHPVTQALREILEAFRSMGFSIVEGPEVELDYYNFEALRIPADHPARDMWDTLWVEDMVDGRRPLLLRTHTSPNQIRIMEQHRPPIRVAVPGRAYRFEATDTTHEWMMTQVEVLAIDEGITMAHMKGTLLDLMRRLFGRERQIRLNCSYFPFVEPGAEVSVDCFVCNGAGCVSCHRTGWLEVMGAGMVHPEIIAGMGIDPDRYTGFAAGMGVERLAMQMYGFDDIRTFYQNDLRVLRQF
jgi:phenylalanyl-tRNA synthetase alpha chain